MPRVSNGPMAQSQIDGDTPPGPGPAESDDAQVDNQLPAPPAVIGRIIGGNFRVLKLIGTGAMGHVFQAEQLSLGKMVALKLLRRELQADEKLTKRFELEAKNASSLDHPNSIQIIDFGRDDDLLYIAMELLPGVDLGQLILREGPLPFPRLGRIMDQVLAALDEAHAHGIVHRDLKPGNIMLISRRDDPDFVKVCDFGIAKAQASPEGAGLTLKGLVCGTPEYMSPEQARGEDVDGRSDLYSVGVILYQLVTGELPFSASSPVGILSKHLAEPPMPPSLRRPGLEIPAALESVILHALAKDPADRPRSAEQLRRALRAAVAGLAEGSATPGGGHALETFDALAAQATTPMGLAAQRARITEPDRKTAPRASGPAHQFSAGPSTPVPPARGRKWWPAAGAAALVGISLWLARRGPENAPATTLSPPPLTAPAAVVARPPAPPSDELAPPALPAPSEPTTIDKGILPAAPVTEAPIAKIQVPRPRARLKSAPAASTELFDTTPPAAEAPVVQEEEAPGHVAPAKPARPIAADPMKEAERLLGQGEIAGACEKGEDQLRITPAAAPVYKFLGKCYMRAGQPTKAMANYRRYLELAPNASDAAFIRSIVR
jgi:tRNA A-37 threonylcarbamoyl transferase component Bud32